MYSSNRTPALQAVFPYMQLLRPANVVTAAADVTAGFVAAGAVAPLALPWLLVAGMALYAGGVVMNDVFDAKLDGVERPERPIPSGGADIRTASALGGGLLLLGVASAWQVGATSAAIAAAIAALALGYDAWGKHQSVLGPLNMGACRGLNLLLGVSAMSVALPERWHLAIIPIAYVGAITAVSRGEVAGGTRAVSALALGLLVGVLASLAIMGVTAGASILAVAPFWAWFGWKTVPAFWAAYRSPNAGTIRLAVGAGVMALIPLNAVIAAAFGGPIAGAVVLALTIPAQVLRRRFAVT